MREFFLALFLASGVLKAQLLILLPWFPDVTLLSLAYLVPLLFFRYARSEAGFVPPSLFLVGLFFAFSIGVLASALYSPSGLMIAKLTKFSLVVFTFLIALTTNDVNWQRFTLAYLMLIFLAALQFIYIFPQYRLGLLGAESEFYGGSYLGFGNSCAMAIILYHSFFHENHLVSKLLITMFFTFCMVLSGARAPIIFLALFSLSWMIYIFVIWLLNSRFLSRNLFPILMASVIILSSIVLFINRSESFDGADIYTTLGFSVDRLMLLFGDAKGDSFNVRVNHFSLSLKAIDESIFKGVGLAAYGLSVSGADTWDYPHNLLLEVWVESGLFPFVILTVLLSLVLLRLIVFSRQYWLFVIVTYCLLNAMKSVSFADNRILFFWIGVAVVSSASAGLSRRGKPA